MPRMMRCAAIGGVVLAMASKRSIDCARRALSVIAAPVRELRTMLVSTPAPVMAAALPDIAVMGVDSMQVEKEDGFRNFRKLELNNKALRALTSTTRH